MSNPQAASLNKHKLLSLVSLSRTFFDLDWGGRQAGKAKPQPHCFARTPALAAERSRRNAGFPVPSGFLPLKKADIFARASFEWM
jgi:hypothetical protein